MKQIELTPNTPEWDEHRARHYGASEASAMMGQSKHSKRNELLRVRAGGSPKEFSDWVRANVLDKGDRAEMAARPKIEVLFGIDLYVVGGVSDDYPMLSASFDGITDMEDTVWEHKLRNSSLVEQVRSKNLEPHYYWQLEHQLLVSGAQRAIFSISDDNGDELEYMEYRSIPERRTKLIAGWNQFDIDLNNFQPPEAKPEVKGSASLVLPSISIELIGSVKRSNLPEFRAACFARIDRIKTDLQTDQDFADAEEMVKELKDNEKKLKEAKQRALEQTSDIAELFQTIDEITETARSKRLMLDKLVSDRKDQIRIEIKRSGEQQLAEFMDLLHADLDGIRINVTADFAGAMRSKRTLDSLRDAVDTTLAHAKIEATETANIVKANLRVFNDLVGEYRSLFADRNNLVVNNSPEALSAIVKNRISEHQADEQRRADEARERIREEERRKLEDEQRTADLVDNEVPMPQGSDSMAVVEHEEHLQLHSEKSVSTPLRRPQPLQPGQRPNDDDIVAMLSWQYQVEETEVIGWLVSLDMRSLKKRLKEAA